MWRPAFAFVLLIALGCSRKPSLEEAYSDAWLKFQQGRLDEAETIVTDQLAIKSGEASRGGTERLYLLLCEIVLARGRAPEALEKLEQFTPTDAQLRTRWLIARAEGLNKVDKRREAAALLEEVELRIAESGAADPYSTFKALMVRSSVLSRSGKFDESRLVLRKGLQLATEHGSDFEQAAALLNLSFNRLGPGYYDESLRFARQSMEAAMRAGAGQIVALAENNIGTSYTVLGDLDAAEEYENKAIAQLREIGDLRNLQDSLGELGTIHLERHQPARAIEDFQEAFKIAERIGTPVATGRWAGRVASVLIEERRWDEAESWNLRAQEFLRNEKQPGEMLVLQLNQAAIAAARGQTADAERLYREAVGKSRNEFIKRSTHIGLARLLKNQNRFAEANEEYEKGLEVIGEGGNRFGPTYLDLRIQSFKEYADLLVVQDKKNRALQVVESSRARMLREKLDLPALKIDDVDLKAIQRYARQSGSVLLSYWFAPDRSFVWVVKPDGIHLRELAGAAQLESAIRDYRKIIEDSRDPIAQGIPQARKVSELLLEPVLGDIAGAQRIVIVPDGALHALNLEALPVPGSDRYWIEDVQISVAPSLSILTTSILTTALPAKPAKQSLLLIGAPHAPDTAFPDLSAAISEIEAIQKHFAGSTVSVQTGDDATPDRFLKAKPGGYSIIHFATHAEANQKSPLESAVILSQAGDRYKLSAGEIASLKLEADLVTLSACRSAGARAYGGEGLVGFAWAFLQSGAHSVVAGLWDVSDTSSSQLMDDFYRELSKGLPAASALRAAKLKMLRSSGAQHKPVFWAPFQIFIR